VEHNLEHEVLKVLAGGGKSQQKLTDILASKHTHATTESMRSVLAPLLDGLVLREVLAHRNDVYNLCPKTYQKRVATVYYLGYANQFFDLEIEPDEMMQRAYCYGKLDAKMEKDPASPEVLMMRLGFKYGEVVTQRLPKHTE
jgi:hypothetical protein